MMSDRERHPVEVVDHLGRVLGIETVEEAHYPPGRLHRAFSVILTDGSGRILLQRRSAEKTRFPSRWANACCGHPAPGQPVAAAASRRLIEEIGIGPIVLSEAGIYIYYAADPLTSRVEFEYDHVLTGTVSADEPMTPNPDEVAELRWVTPSQLKNLFDANPISYAPWLMGVIARLEHESIKDPTEPAESSGGR
jgi:isopentenyl-diphosphate delta-isomerase